MNKNLLESDIDRQNILNNPFALNDIRESLGIKTLFFENKYWLITRQVAQYFEVDIKTIQRCLDLNEQELRQNGYEIFTEERLRIAKKMYVSDINVLELDIRTPTLGMFDFRAFLNIAMLLQQSEKAKELRSLILNLAISSINKRVGDATFINQNAQAYKNIKQNYDQKYNTKLINDLKDCVEMSNTKYIYFNYKIYQFLFLEKAKEYRQLLDLKNKQKSIDTHYHEILTHLATFETDFAQEIQENFEINKSKLTKEQVEDIFNKLTKRDRFEPILDSARYIISSRDSILRGVDHQKLLDYKKPLTIDTYLEYINENGIPELTTDEKKQIEKNKSEDLFIEDKEILERMKNK